MLGFLRPLFCMIVVSLTALCDKREISCPISEEVGISQRTVRAPEGLGDEYKFLVLIITSYENGTGIRRTQCTGTIVRDSIILTAGHCVEPDPEYNEKLADVDVYSLSCSKTHFSDCSKSRVQGFVNYPEVARTDVNFDIALFFIFPKISTSKHPPICDREETVSAFRQPIHMSSFNTADAEKDILILTEMPLSIRKPAQKEPAHKWFFFDRCQIALWVFLLATADHQFF